MIASSVTTLKVKPNSPSTMTVPVRVMGMASTTEKVEPKRPRKSSTIKATAAEARSVSRKVSKTELATKTLVSPVISVR